MSYSPAIKAEFAYRMIFSPKPRKQKGKEGKDSKEGEEIREREERRNGGERNSIDRMAMAVQEEVIAEPTEEMSNFYTEGIVQVGNRKSQMHKILIDGGFVVNLIPDGVAREIVAIYCKNNDLRI